MAYKYLLSIAKQNKGKELICGESSNVIRFDTNDGHHAVAESKQP